MNQTIIYSLTGVIAIILNGGMRILNFWLSPTGRVLDAFNTTLWVIQVGIVVILILYFVLQMTNNQDFDERLGFVYRITGIYVLAGLISFPIGYRIAQPIQEQGYSEFIADNQILVDAIQQFERENDRSPNDLEELYPHYLGPEIATLNSGQIEIDLPYQSLDRRSSEDVLYSLSPADEDDPWQLQVSIYLGSFQSTRFVYRPDETYSSRYVPLNGWGIDE